jgi:hypothetical protein
MQQYVSYTAALKQEQTGLWGLPFKQFNYKAFLLNYNIHKNIFYTIKDINVNFIKESSKI